jgi:hypothetical protein
VEPASCELKTSVAKRLQLIHFASRRDSTNQRQSPAGQAPLPDRRHHQLTRLLDLPMNNRKSKPPLPDSWAIEQDFVARWPDGREKRFSLRIGLPALGVDNQGQPSWNAVMLLDGLLEPFPNPARGDSSFTAVYVAFAYAKQLIRENTEGARFYYTGGTLGDQVLPEGGLKLQEIFHRFL